MTEEAVVAEKHYGGERTENIHLEMAVAKEKTSLSCKALEKLETSGERPGPKHREK